MSILLVVVKRLPLGAMSQFKEYRKMSDKLHPAIKEISQLVLKLLPDVQLTGRKDEEIEDDAFIVVDPRSDTFYLAIESRQANFLHAKDYLTFSIIARHLDTTPYIYAAPLTVFKIGLRDFTQMNALSKELYIAKVITTFNGYISYDHTAGCVSMLMNQEYDL